ncbi:MAG: hypothetical protein WBL45_04075 [Solirubrobacterales bacterium]
MAAVREAWTDERLDDLNHRVDEGFREMREEFRAVRFEMREEFAAVRSEMAAMHRATMQMMATMMVGFAGTITTVLLSA